MEWFQLGSIWYSAKQDENMENTAMKESTVTCRTHSGWRSAPRWRGCPVTWWCSRFTIRRSSCRCPRRSTSSKSLLDGRAIYWARGDRSRLVHTGTTLVCEATLDETCLDTSALFVAGDPARSGRALRTSCATWGKSYRIHPEFKVLIAAVPVHFRPRLWLGPVELGIRSRPAGDHPSSSGRC